jgi:phosphotriesterase-related protein
MADSELRNKAQTVLGTIEPDELGIVLTHEHLTVDLSDFFVNPAPEDQRYVEQPITLENLGWIRSHCKSNLENLRPFEEELAVEEVLLFKKHGGNTIVEQTPNNMGRDPGKLANVARATGVNIIMGTAIYRETFTVGDYGSGSLTKPGTLKKYDQLNIASRSEQEIAAEFIRDIRIGVEDTGVRAGVIGEVGCSYPLTPNETKVLRAAVHAQQETGALLTVHPGFNEGSPPQIVDTLQKMGADLSRLVICHMDMSMETTDGRLRLADSGCYLEWDLFGQDGFPRQATPISIPSDWMRVAQIVELVEGGYIEQILVSHDICPRHRLARYGGFGYAHILQTIVPIMQQKGLSEKDIEAILRHNPKRALTFV